MGCQCSKKSASSKYEVTMPNGSKKAYNSELEAAAAVRRAPGATYKKV